MVGLPAVSLTSMKIQEIAYSDNPKLNKTPKSSVKNTILGLSCDNSEFLLRDLYLRNAINEEYIPVEINFASLSGEDSDEEKFVGVIRNFSVQKETEQLRDDFIATLTHDLRTPLLAAIQMLRFFWMVQSVKFPKNKKLYCQQCFKVMKTCLGL